MAQTLGRLFGWAHKYSFRQARAHLDRESSTSIVRIRNLKSCRDDGILFPGDKLSDVADDREQIIADFEENFPSLSHYNCGDGTSNSSVCTGSPDLFSVEVSSHDSVHYAHSDVEITDESAPSGITPLQVRRGSEPALNSLCPTSPTTDPSKRWSTAVVINPECPEQQKTMLEENSKPATKDTLAVNGEAKPSRNFSRSSGRLSILGNSAETYRWLEAADRQLMKDMNEKLSIEPVVTNGSDKDGVSDSSSVGEEREQTVILKNESGPLGIHVLPDYDTKGRDTGLVIQGIEAGGRIDRDGRFRVGDRIVEINGQSLRSISFQAAQEVFKDALRAPQIKLELLRGPTKTVSKTAATIPRKPPPPVYPKPVLPAEEKRPEEDKDSTLVEGEERVGGVTTKVATVTPTKKMPPGTTHNLAAANTRRIGKKISIQLTKGSSGLGFSVTTRDNPAGGSSPIYIKNVLPKGAAIEDGRLKPGDRLLEVNGVEMSGMSQSEAVGILRNVPQGGTVNLVVSRQEVESSPEPEPNSQPSMKAEEESGIFPWKHREILTFQIPMNGAGKTGLGVHIIGKSTSASSNSADLGIFIKAIIPGGAASKDGRLQAKDQLVNINGISLLGIANNLAMDTLRNAMSQLDGPIPNTIILTIARRITHPPDDEPDNSSVHSKMSNSQASVFSNSSERRHMLSNGPEHFDSYNGTLNTPLKDLANIQKMDSNPPGSNPIIDRLTGQTMNNHFKKLPTESLMFGMANNISQNSIPSRSDFMLPMYSPTICVPSSESVMIEGEYNSTIHRPKSSVSSDSVLYQHNNGNSLCDGGVVPACSQLSLDNMNDAFTRDGFGRQSMSEKRHAQLNAKNTDTYQRNKKVREERERTQPEDEQGGSTEERSTFSSHGKSDSHLIPISSASSTGEPRGPSLGLRKSSSLESLQTMIQELNKDDEAMKAAQSSNRAGGSRSRGCNESFRAAVDRSYEAPVAATMETLDEESESGSSVSHILGRAVEFPELSEPGISRDPFSENAINLYCRSSKNSKKKSLLKGLGSVFKFGKGRKGKAEVLGQDGEQLPPHLIHPLPNREQDRISEQDQKILDGPKKPLPSVPRESSSSSMSEPISNRQERMQNLREQHQRLHQIRQGHYPLEHKEEFYESEIQAKEGRFQPNADIIHMRSHSHDEILSSSKSRIRPIQTEPERYSHYMNYKEIQQQMTQYHHNQGPKVPFAQTSSSYKPKSVPHQPERPSSNFFEYESVQQLHRHAAKQMSDSDTSSLPRSSHLAEHSVPHLHAQNSNKHFYNQDYSGGYERRNIYHYYPNNNNGLYSHVVPGSKV